MNPENKQRETTRETVQNMRRRTVRLERDGTYWEPEEIDSLIQEFAQGTGITEIALLLRRTERAVVQQIEKRNLYQGQRGRSRKKPAENSCGKCLCEFCSAPPEACPCGRKEKEGD